MYLISLLFFLIAPIISFPIVLIGLFMDRKHEKIYAFLFIFLVCILLYNLIPKPAMDLYRYYEYMESVKNYDFLGFIKIILTKTEFCSYFLLYLFSLTGKNGLIMVFTTIISYSILFYCIFDFLNINDISKKDRAIILIYFICTFLIIANITGLRLCLARLIFFLALYLDLVKNKRNFFVYFLYIISVFFHTSAIVLLLLRMLFIVFKNKFSFRHVIILLFLTFFQPIFLKFSSFLSNISFLSSLSSRIDIYLSGTYSGSSNIYLLQITMLLFSIFITLIVKYKCNNVNDKLVNFALMLQTFSMAFISKSAISTRFIVSCITISNLINIELMKNLKSRKKVLFSFALILISIPYFIYQIVLFKDTLGYGNLFSDGLVSNAFSLIFK